MVIRNQRLSRRGDGVPMAHVPRAHRNALPSAAGQPMNAGERFDVAVIGGGVMGCAAAHSLAARKKSVILFETSQIGHHKGSSHGQTRIIRLAYGQIDYIALCRAAYPAWRHLEAGAGEPLLHITGGLDVGFGPVPSWRATAAAMSQAHVPHDVLDGDGIRQRFPQFTLPDDAVGLWQPQAGVLHADRCLAALANGARRLGASLRENQEVVAVTPSTTGFALRTTKSAYHAQRLVIACGAASGEMFRRVGLDLPLSVSSEQVAFFQPRNPVQFGPERFPVFIIHLGGALLSSGFPLIRENGMKLMIENKRPLRDGDEALDPELLRRLEDTVRQILPGLDHRALRAETCRYTLTPDEDFIIDRHPADARIVIASACSGHGFKFAPLIGEALADLVAGRAPAINLDPFRIDRPALKEAMNKRMA